MLSLPEIQVGEPMTHEGLSVFPLFSAPGGDVNYLLSDEAIGAGTLSVEEVNESGSVPELMVTNSGDTRVLFIEGEELRGAKQNRVLNTSVLIGARSKVKIPVSCVEQGRWAYRSRRFGSSGTHSSSKLRAVLKQSVSESARRGEGHRSDQSKVWKEVSRQMDSFACESPSMAMSDTYEALRERREAVQARIDYVEGATGVAVALGGKVVAIDLFDKPSTCRKAWDRLLSGFVMDALEPGQQPGSSGAAEVRALLDRLGTADWKPAPAVGEGEEFRADAEDQTHASALLFGGSVVHESAVVAAAT
jgi:hypothetical protein